MLLSISKVLFGMFKGAKRLLLNFLTILFNLSNIYGSLDETPFFPSMHNCTSNSLNGSKYF